MAVSGGLIDGGGGGFHEEDHPRDEGGKFTESGKGDGGGAGGTGAASDADAAKDEKKLKSLARPGYHRATPEEQKARGVPPAWTDVHINDDPNARHYAVGRDRGGNQQDKYSAEHAAIQLQEKFERCRLFDADLPGIAAHLDYEIEQQGKNHEEASALRLILISGFRVGGEDTKGAKVKAYGASTLEGRHVTIKGDAAHFDFTGKLGVQQVHDREDAALAADLAARKEAAGDDGKLFDTSDDKIRKYLKVAAGKNYKVHDFRTWNATEAARKFTEENDPPQSAEEYWEKRDQAGQAAADWIGDTLDIALSTYVDPIVFEDWRSRAGVADDAEKPKRAGKAKAGDGTSAAASAQPRVLPDELFRQARESRAGHGLYAEGT